MDEWSDGDLVERIRAGEEAAAREFFRRMYPQILRIVRNHLPRKQSEEDLCQVIFMQAFAKIDQYSGVTPVSHWLSRIAVNTCLNALKTEQRRPEIREADLSEEQKDLLGRLADPSGPAADTEQCARELVAVLLLRLKPLDRLILTLLHMEGCSVAEASARTGFSRAIIKIRAFRARRKLNREMRTLLQEDFP